MARRPPALIFIFITLFLDIFGIGLVAPILPRLIESFSAGGVVQASYLYGWLVALYSLMQFVFAPLLGALSDRYGRRPIILGSLLGAGLDYLLLAFAPTLGWFFVGRILAGIMGANITAASAYIADVSPPEKRAQNFGLVGAAFGLGFIAGPALGGLLGDIGLRTPFLVAAGVTLLNWCYGLFILPESLPPEKRGIFRWNRANPVGSFLALRRYPVVFGLAGTFFLANFAHQVFPAIWVLYTGYRYQWSVGQTGLSLALVGLMAAVMQGGLTRVVIPRLGERRATLFGLGLLALGLIAYGLADTGWKAYVLIVLVSPAGIATPAIQGLISRSIRDDEQGAVQGALASLGSVAGIAGPPVVTALFSYFIGPTTPLHLPGAPFFFSSLLTVVAVFLALRSFSRS
jgi:DHA1 family tetracycline resistance protein-like MFS transporter